jgi:hypothetical protein
MYIPHMFDGGFAHLFQGVLSPTEDQKSTQEDVAMRDNPQESYHCGLQVRQRVLRNIGRPKPRRRYAAGIGLTFRTISASREGAKSPNPRRERRADVDFPLQIVPA